MKAPLCGLAFLLTAACSMQAHAQSSSKGEADVVRVTALRHLMLKHSKPEKQKDPDFPLLVLENVEFVTEFADFIVPVVAYSKDRFQTVDGRDTDMSTGKPVVIWSVDAAQIDGDRAQVGVSWSTGVLGGGVHTVFLKKQDGKWIAGSDRVDILAENGAESGSRG